MSKADVIEVEGVVVEKLPNAFFKVSLVAASPVSNPRFMNSKDASKGV